MSGLSKLFLRILMWGGVATGVFLLGMAGLLAYALFGGSDQISAGGHPEAGLVLLSGLAFGCLFTAFVVRREINKPVDTDPETHD